MARQQPADHLPAAVLARADFAAACARHDLGTVLALAKQWGGPGFTASHLARRCDLTVARVQDYVHGRRQAQSIDVFARVCDGLRIPGAMFNLAPRPWEGMTVSPTRAPADEFGVRSHKFIPVFTGQVESLAEKLRAVPAHIGSLSCRKAFITIGDKLAGDLYLFDWGICVLHIVERPRCTSIAELAVWRRRTHRSHRHILSEYLTTILGRDIVCPYVLSCFWLAEPTWSGPELHTAVRLLCMPRTLLGPKEQEDAEDLTRARTIERRLFTEGFTPVGQVNCGIDGVAIGWASWSGVAYHPIDQHAALREDNLVQCELLTQALWCLCDTIIGKVHDGDVLALPAAVGWRWLRGHRAQITQAGPAEPSAVRSLRTAILETSELPAKLTEAIELLKEDA